MWERWTPALHALLQRTPLLVRDGDGLAALFSGATSADLQGARQVLRSLRRVYVVDGAADLRPPTSAPPLVRVDARVEAAWRPAFVTPPGR